MKTLIWILPFLTNSVLAQADKAPIPYGHYRTIQAKTLGEARTLLVRLPIDYGKGAKTYPVLYKLDGGIDGALQAFAGVNYLADMTDRVPDHIVVGIENTNRGRDMGAGRENFLRFIGTELIPFIDANYRTSRFRILSGESASATFGMYAFLTEPKLFQGYILASFAFGWPELVSSFEDGLKQAAKARDPGKRYLFVTNGRHDAYDRDGSRTRAGERFLDSIRQSLPAVPLKYQVYEDEGHVPFPSLYDGLRWIYAQEKTAAYPIRQ